MTENQTPQKPWFKNWKTISLLVVFSPVILILIIALWFISFPVLIFINYRSTNFPKFGKFMAGFLSILLVILVYGTIEESIQSKELQKLMMEGKFELVKEKIEDEKYADNGYMDEVNKMTIDGINEIINVLANQETNSYEDLINTMQFSEYELINKKVKDVLLTKIDDIYIAKDNIKAIKAKEEEQRVAAEEKAQQLTSEEDIQQIQYLIPLIRDGKKSIGQISNIVSAFSADNKFIAQDRSELINVARAYQRKQFPILRKEYADKQADELWKNDYEVTTKGAGYTTIVFEHWSFASNGSIDRFNNQIYGTLKDLRFDRVEYRWTKYSSYTYYDLNSPSDDFIEGVDEE